MLAFEDTWAWDQAASAAFNNIVEGPFTEIARTLIGFRRILGETDMLAYLSMMAPQLVKLRRILKPTWNIYLHCDPPREPISVRCWMQFSGRLIFAIE